MGLVIFDLGDVIMMNCRSLRSMAEELGINDEDFIIDYKRYNAALMDGWCTTRDYYRHLEIEYGVEIKGELFTENYNPTINSYVMDMVRKLKIAGHRVVIGSNTFECYNQWTKKNLPGFYANFSSIYLSNQIHRSKPDPSFWRYIMEIEGFSPSDTYFVDDRKENIDSASSLGIKSYLYDGDNKDLEKFFKPLF